MPLLNNNPLFLLNNNSAHHVTDFIFSKGYVSNEEDLPKSAIIKTADNNVTYLLSKLSDEELFRLLSDQPYRSEYKVKDLVQISTDTKHKMKYDTLNLEHKFRNIALPNAILENHKKTRFHTVSQKSLPQAGFFRLEHKEIDPFAVSNSAATQSSAVQKINNLLNGHPVEAENGSHDDMDEEKKELLFDILVAQLKTLCCKRNKTLKKKDKSKLKLTSFLSHMLLETPNISISMSIPENTELKTTQLTLPNEYLFLIFNDEIKSAGNDVYNLISVDPDSLGKNSSAMLLGPIVTPLSDAQLKIMMMRISNELAKPEYLPILQQISEGALSNDHIGLKASIVHGPQTRRYIKPHRCNHQSQMKRIYGGPKWLICTGYLNLNKPSLYD